MTPRPGHRLRLPQGKNTGRFFRLEVTALPSRTVCSQWDLRDAGRLLLCDWQAPGFPSRPTPCLENNGFPLLPPAAHSAPHPALLPGPERGVGGAAAAGAVGTRADAYNN